MAKLIFNYGVMKSGKSLDLIRTFTNYQHKGQVPLVLKSSIDTRDDKIKTRIGEEIFCELLGPNDLITDLLSEDRRGHPPVILIDEAQFLTAHQVLALTILVDTYNIDVICYGLKLDYTGRFFEGSKMLFEEADKVQEIKMLCAFCNKKATHNILTEMKEDGYRYCCDTGTGSNVKIGDEDYFQCCRNHFYFYSNRNRKLVF